jgi:tRNA (Thr-GGU) A37 N-methylase
MTQNQQDSITEQLEIISDLRFFLSRANSRFEADKTVSTYSVKVKAAAEYDKAVKGLEDFKKFNNL